MLESNDNTHPLELLFNPKNVVILRVGGAIEPMVKGFKRQGFDLENLYLISPREEFPGVKML